jgi:SAM-dependent methyltransferase
VGELQQRAKLSAVSAYFIKDGYREQANPEYFEDIYDDVCYQPHVYPKAAELARRLGCGRIIDIGCGHAEKLVALHSEFEIMGLDYGSNVEYCRRYGVGTWIEWDIERDPLPSLPAEGSVIVCADVIEHLIDPRTLLGHLKTLLQDAAAGLMSTPERDLTHGPDHFGPPPNACHVREWNLEELGALLTSEGLPPVQLELTASEDRYFVENTILATLPGAHLRDADALLTPS